MTQEEIAVKFEGHEHEIKSLKHRTKELEDQNKIIQDLALSVKELAVNMTNMNDEQKAQGARLLAVESRPAKKWETVTTDIIKTVIALAIGYAFSFIK
jgi:hypothetical protein